MRPRVVAASTATLIAASALSPIAAQAAGQNTIFVNNASSACTDSGTGAVGAPYCTIQAAADAANPGDIVNVAVGTYSATTITRSGTASAPIIFTGNGVRTAFGINRAAIASFDVNGASFVKIQNFNITSGSAADAYVGGGSDVTFSSDLFRPTTAGPALHVTGAASAVTVRDSQIDSEVLVDGGSTGTIVTTNAFAANYASPISIVGAANTAITSNTIYGCGTDVSVIDSASATSIENNVIENPQTSATDQYCPASSQATGMLVDSTSASGTTADYNDVYASGTGAVAYEWAGTAYASAAALHAARSQAQHDDNSLLGTETVEHSPLINSANSAAIGEQPADINGNPRVIDPLVAQTGAGPYGYYDRGATQFQDPVTLTLKTFTASASQAPVGGTITLHAAATDTWSTTFDYLFELSNSTTIDGGTSGTATVSYSSPGNYGVYLYLKPTNGSPAPLAMEGNASITVVPDAQLTPQLTVNPSGALGVVASDAGSTDAWNLTSATFDFGDGTPTQTVTGQVVSPTHTYAKPGTYTITEKLTDADGITATKSATFTTALLPAGVLINLAGNSTTNVPDNSIGIAQAAVAALPNGSGQLVAATTAGTVEFATGTSEGNVWQAWQSLSQPGVTAKWVGIAGMPNGSSQVIEVTSTGSLRHIVRNANGTWQPGGWGTPSGSTGFANASITAMPDGSTQLLAVTTSGVLMHDIRYANGSWQGWRALSQPGVTITDAGIAGMPDGSSQIVEVTSTHVMKHDIRYSNGRWQPQGWAVPPGGVGIKTVSITEAPMFSTTGPNWGAVISTVTTQGVALGGTRDSSGAWAGWWTMPPEGLGILGTAAVSTVSVLPDGNELTFAVSGK